MTAFMQRIICWTLLASVAAARAAETLSWPDCVSLAAGKNPALVASQKQVEAAEAAVRVARSALLPQLSAGASADRSGRSGAESPAGTSYSASMTVEQSLYSGGQKQASIRTAQSSLEGAAASGDSTGVQLTYDLRSAFIDVLYATEQVALLRTIETRRENNLELVELRYEGGREHKGSLASSQASLFDAQVQVTQAVRRASVNRATLGRTIGLAAVPEDATFTGSMDSVTGPTVSDLDTVARDTPSYQESLAAIHAAEAGLTSARSGYRPDLSLSGSAGRSGDDEAFDDDSWSVGVKLSFPLWSGGKAGHDVQRAQAALASAQAGLAQTLNDLVSQLTQARQSLVNAVEDVTVQERYVSAAELRAEIARQQYEDGLLAFENWILIEDDLIAKKKQLLDVRRSAMLTEAAWWRASGQSAFSQPQERSEVVR